MKLKDSEYKNSSLVGQTNRKNTKDKINVLVKCFANSFTKIPPISARSMPKLPEMSLSEPRKKSKKRIAIAKLLLQQVKLTAKIGRRRLNYFSNDLLTHSEKILQYVLKMCQTCLKCQMTSKFALL